MSECTLCLALQTCGLKLCVRGEQTKEIPWKCNIRTKRSSSMALLFWTNEGTGDAFGVTVNWSKYSCNVRPWGACFCKGCEVQVLLLYNQKYAKGTDLFWGIYLQCMAVSRQNVACIFEATAPPVVTLWSEWVWDTRQTEGFASDSTALYWHLVNELAVMLHVPWAYEEGTKLQTEPSLETVGEVVSEVWSGKMGSNSPFSSCIFSPLCIFDTVYCHLCVCVCVCVCVFLGVQNTSTNTGHNLPHCHQMWCFSNCELSTDKDRYLLLCWCYSLLTAVLCMQYTIVGLGTRMYTAIVAKMKWLIFLWPLVNPQLEF